ncbi:MAG: ABC transporter substrate-binding protein [Deltaproteobacteria bacterium]|jgi:NitT/TauT family transport system substrate-binding protein|nr:ABC transporter substrate-binding protein [Deltaproteobacteria bacterium]
MKLFLNIFLIYFLLPLLGFSSLSTPLFAAPLKIGLLPVADTILIIAAESQGFFKARGLEVDLVFFQSAIEKDSAAMAGSIDGHFCEIISSIVQVASGKNFKVIATTTYTSPERRMFGLVTSPAAKDLSLEDLKGKRILIAKQTITDFLTDIFLEKQGLPLDYMQRQDVRKIPVRMQLLLSDQAEATLIPEPMLSVAEKANGTVLLDDRNLNMPLATVALNASLPAETIKAFQDALSDSIAWINAHPVEGKALMVMRALIPPDLEESYVLPIFDPNYLPMKLPDKELYDKYIAYLQKIGVLKGQANPEGLPVPAYEDVVYIHHD